ncbi:MAG TPA: serine/threonine-protein phosphatase [Syntrophobacteraceae bacterium]|nr:serine/threonine-protein phosphatase [Syntrophobacteraceae bacterium]
MQIPYGGRRFSDKIKELEFVWSICLQGEVDPRMMMVESAGLTDIGRRRTSNEDAVFCDDGLRLFVVADGMGGHQAGEVASRLVVETIRDAMREYIGVDSHRALEGYDRNLSLNANKVCSSILRANRVVNQLSAQEGAYRRMGSTVSAAFFTDETLVAANVGDSPIWLVHDGSMELLSVPHTLVAEQAKLNPGRDDNLAPGFRNLLTRAVGIESSVRADVCELPCFEGDTLIMASDGLSNKVTADEILDLVSRKRPEEACHCLVNLANERGGDDNITVVVARVMAVPSQHHSFLTRLQRWLGRKQ